MVLFIWIVFFLMEEFTFIDMTGMFSSFFKIWGRQLIKNWALQILTSFKNLRWTSLIQTLKKTGSRILFILFYLCTLKTRIFIQRIIISYATLTYLNVLYILNIPYLHNMLYLLSILYMLNVLIYLAYYIYLTYSVYLK